MATTELRLTDAERQSALWKKLEEHLTTYLAELRAKNDADLSPELTIKLRGRIAEVNRILLAAVPREVQD